MTQTKKEAPTPERAAQEAEVSPPTPTLSESYFQALLKLPSCKSRGYCDNCGRCER